MVAVKLTKSDFVTTGLQSGNNPATTIINWQNVVPGAVRNIEAWLPDWLALDDKARRKRNHALAKIAIDEAERNRVRGAIRKPAHGNASRIDGHCIEHTIKRAIYQFDVGSKTATKRVPGRIARVRRQHGDSSFIGGGAQIPEHVVSALRCAVQHKQKRKRRQAYGFRQLQNRITISGSYTEHDATSSCRLDTNCRTG